MRQALTLQRTSLPFSGTKSTVFGHLPLRRLFTTFLSEEAASKGKMGDVFLAIRTVSGKTTSAVTAPIAKLDGSACSTTDEVLDRWREHYESALNHPAGSVCHELNDYAAAAQEDANVCTDEPTL